MPNQYQNATIVDVRTSEEFAEGHISNAINIPLDQVQTRLDDFKSMQKPIVLYCRSGSRSGTAQSLLKQHGMADVVNGGGLSDMEKQVQ